MNSRRWQDHFQEAASKAELTIPAASGQNPLIAIFQQGLISENDYLNWAQSTFELPILKNSYFLDHAGDGGFWTKWQSKYAWQVDCLPVCEWDGTLFVACLEPKEFSADMNVVCLLTSVTGLQMRWNQYQNSAQLQEETPAAQAQTSVLSASEAPENFEPSAKIAELSIAQPAKDESFSFEPLQLDGDTSAGTKMDLDQVPEALELDPVLDSAPSGLEALSPAAESVDATEAKPLSAISLEPLSAVTAETIVTEPAPQATSTPTEAPVAAPKPAATASILTKAVPASNSVFFLESALKKNPNILDAKTLFASMKSHFEKSLLLAVDTLERTAKPISWGAEFAAPAIINEISLTTPSIFRIANSTQRPYHGGIVQNEINDQFFAEWNSSKIPDHVTLVPIVIEDHVIGLLMGFAGAEAFNRTSLQFTEDLVKDLTAKMSVAAKQAA